MNFMESNEKKTAKPVAISSTAPNNKPLTTTVHRTPMKSKFEPTPTHPEGEFDGTIKMTKIKTHERKGEYVMLVVETRAGTAFSSLFFNDPTQAFMDSDGTTPVTFADLAKRELKRIIMSAYKKTATIPTKIDSLAAVAAELKGLPVRVKVIHKTYNDKVYANVRFGKVNEIDRIDCKPGTEQVALEDVEAEQELGF